MTKKEMNAASSKIVQQLDAIESRANAESKALRKTFMEKMVKPYEKASKEAAQKKCKELNAKQKKGKGLVWDVYEVEIVNEQEIYWSGDGDGDITYCEWDCTQDCYKANDGSVTKCFNDKSEAQRFASGYQKCIEAKNKVDTTKVLQEQIIALRKDLAKAITGKKGK